MGRDHSVECPLCDLSYGGLNDDDIHCPDCGPLMLVKIREHEEFKAERDALAAEVEALKAENASDRAIQGEAEHRALERADAMVALVREAMDLVPLGDEWIARARAALGQP